MSTNSNQNPQEKEIDLAAMSNKINDFSIGVKSRMYNVIDFILRHKIALGLLFLIGLGLGIYLDKTNKTYETQLVVSPNFGSVDLLYTNIELLNSKAKEKDTTYLSRVGIKQPIKLAKIEVEPIVDPYQFVNSNEKNFDLLRLMAEDADMTKILEESTTSKNYNYHLISIVTRSKTQRDLIVTPLLKFLNSSDYFRKIQKAELENQHIRMRENEVIIKQIDNFLGGIGTGNGASDKLVYYNENSPLNDVIKTKERLILEQGFLRTSLISKDMIIKEVSQVMNIEKEQTINGNLKFILPLVLISIFVFFHSFIGFYRSQKKLRETETV